MTKITIENMEQEVEVSVHAHEQNDLSDVLAATELLFNVLLVDAEGKRISNKSDYGDLL